MYENEYLEKCLKENQGSYYLLWGYRNTKDNKYNELVIDDLGFIYNKEQDLKLFKEELVKAGIEEFILTDTSTALMKILHALNKVGVKIKEVAEIKYTDKWDNTESTLQGIKMIIC